MKFFKRLCVLGASILFVGTILFFGPVALHALYRAQTSAASIQAEMHEYNQIENQESALHGQALIDSQNRRYEICLWLSARGVSNFEGEGSDTSPPIWQPWADLFNYWRN